MYKDLVQEFKNERLSTNITSPDKVKDFCRKHEMKSDTFRVIYTNTKACPVAYRDFDISEGLISTNALKREIFEDVCDNMIPTMFFSVNRSMVRNELRNIEDLKEVVGGLCIEVVDVLGYDGFGVPYSQKEDRNIFELRVEYGGGASKSLLDSFPSVLTKCDDLNSFLERKNEIIPVYDVKKEIIGEQLANSYSFMSENDIDGLADYFTLMSDYTREVGTVIGLKNGDVVGVNELFKGASSSALIDPRYMMKNLREMEADAFVFAHNHPSNSPIPSQEDERMAKQLTRIGEHVGIVHVDSLIVGGIELETNVGHCSQVMEYEQSISRVGENEVEHSQSDQSQKRRLAQMQRMQLMER